MGGINMEDDDCDDFRAICVLAAVSVFGALAFFDFDSFSDADLPVD